MLNWCAQIRHYETLILQVISQTERRVFGGEKVPASEKCVSLFEPHTDIIVKGARDVQYGHKINLSSGRSGLILDVVIESGNPADSQRFMPILNDIKRTMARCRDKWLPMAAMRASLI